jgi:hypothetical protein
VVLEDTVDELAGEPAAQLATGVEQRARSAGPGRARISIRHRDLLILLIEEGAGPLQSPPPVNRC